MERGTPDPAGEGVLWLDEVTPADLPRVGRKGFTLARLRQEGFPVPDGFVLPPGVPAERALDARARLPGALAVRSSSSAEDTADASFAGQYRTVLGVTGDEALLEAVRTCRESAAGAAGYARALGAAEGSLAVLVQRMVAPRAAGVAFTEDPRDPTACLVEAHAGLGDVLVSGAVTPDRWAVDRASGTVRDGPAAGALDGSDLRAVVDLARRVEEALGGPQDVEWAIAGEGPVVLQARPPTVEAEARPDPRLRRLTRANVGEVLPDPVTPLTWSTVGSFLEHGFRRVADEAGLLPRDAPAFLALHRRRLYLNLSLSAEVAARLPGVTAADAERLVLGGGAAGEPPPLRLSSLPGFLRVALRLRRLARRLPALVAEAERVVEALPRRESVERAEPPELAALLEDFATRGRALAFAHIASSGSCGFRLALLGGLLGRFLPGDAFARTGRLVTGLDGVASAAPALALESLAEEVARRPEWRAWLETEAARSGDRSLPGAPAGLRERIAGFLERYGHRAVSEGELSAPAWEDEPGPLLRALSGLAGSDGAAGWRGRARAEVRRADEEAALARLGPLRRAALRAAIRGAQQGVRGREHTKSLTVALVHHGRRLARAAARRLVSAGALEREDDVFFLELAELGDCLRGAPGPRARVERRRRRHAREGALPAPREVDLAGGESPGESAPGGGGIGIGGGVGLGPARVVLSGEAPRLEPGEVLVTPVLDAALGPLLASAAGAVAEIGGVLSHGAVVARELGVPCVVDVRDATRRFRTGQRLLVDGGAGTVSVAPEPTDGPEAAGPAGPACLEAEDTASDSLHALAPHPRARESVYFNVQDPSAGLVLVASLGVRPGGRGESLVALGTPEGHVLFGLDLAPGRPGPGGFSVAGQTVDWSPFRFRAAARLARHAERAFPPGGVLPLLLEPRTEEVAIDLTLAPTTPAVDFCRGLPEDALQALRPLGAHHLEQSGAWHGTVSIGGRPFSVAGTGSRDHSWGLRDWDAADHWRLFTVRFGDGLAVHALAVSVEGRLVEGGFLWRDGRAERITRVAFVGERGAGGLRTFELSLATAAGPPLRLHGTVLRRITVPVDVERRPLRHLQGLPYRLVLHEHFARYEAAGRVGHGIAELTERPGAG